MNRRLHLRVLGAVFLFVIVGAAFYFGGVFAQLELSALDRAAQANALLHCCAGPHYPRSEQMQSEAADQCPRSLRMMRWVSRGVSESAAQARQILGGNCPAAKASSWSETPAPPSPPAVTPPPAASAARDAGQVAPDGPAETGPTHWAAPPTLAQKANALDCEELPPSCGDAGPCPPLSRAALLAAVDLPPEKRAERLRSWLCDKNAAAEVPGLVRELGVALAGQAFTDGGAADAGPAADALRGLCGLPWEGALGEDQLLAALGCPPCPTRELENCDNQDGCPVCTAPNSESPGRHNDAACLAAYAQGALDLGSDDLPDEIGACRGQARAAGEAWSAGVDRRRLESARRSVARLRASAPLGAAQWSELVASLQVLYGERQPLDLPGLQDTKAEPLDAARTALVRAEFKLPPSCDGEAHCVALPPAARMPIRSIALPGDGGTIAAVCDRGGNERYVGMYWLKGPAVVEVERARAEFNPYPSCDALAGVVDLDGDGTLELLVRRTQSGEEGVESYRLDVVTLADPPVFRGGPQPTLYVTVNVPAECSAGGVRLQAKPGAALAIPVPPGTARVTCSAAGFEDASAEAAVVLGEQAAVHLKLAHKCGPLPAKGAVEPKSGLGFVVIPAGPFHFRSQQAMTFQEFRLGETEVTTAAYAKCVSAGACSEPAAPAASSSCNWKSGRDDHPINCVDWNDATAFCKWIGGRLPTEQEWEYAALGGGAYRTYPWGTDAPAAQACWARNPVRTGSKTTCRVGCFADVSLWGAQDLGGNVEEWTSGAGEPDNSGRKVVRGGSWTHWRPEDLKTWNRRWQAPPTERRMDLGFRCVADPATLTAR